MNAHALVATPVRRVISALLVALVAGCATAPQPSSPPSPDMPAERVAAPGETALALGIKSYQGAQYAEAETQFKAALQLGLSIGPDRASAHKYLAFIYCTSRRESLCAAAFKAARQADPAFALSKSEAGHPMWGPVYRKALPPTP